MEQRRRKIDGYIQKAEKINKQALQSLDKYEKALQKAKNDADAHIEQNRLELIKTISDKHTEIEDILNRKIFACCFWKYHRRLHRKKERACPIRL